MNTESNNTEAPQWAIIELMGHVKYGGLVSKDNKLGTAMLRVDVPQQNGTFVSQLINPSSLYRITFCAEEIGRAAAAQGDAKPLGQWELRHLLPAPQAAPAIEVTGGHDTDDEVLF